MYILDGVARARVWENLTTVHFSAFRQPPFKGVKKHFEVPVQDNQRYSLESLHEENEEKKKNKENLKREREKQRILNSINDWMDRKKMKKEKKKIQGKANDKFQQGKEGKKEIKRKILRCLLLLNGRNGVNCDAASDP